MIQTLLFEACRRYNLAPQFIFVHKGAILLRAGSSKLSWVIFFFLLPQSFLPKTDASKASFYGIHLVLQWHVGKQMQEEPESIDTAIPLDSCSTENGNHLMFTALPSSTELKWQFSWVGDCFCNLSGNKEMANKDGFFFFPPLKTPCMLRHENTWHHLSSMFNTASCI